jgi:hypothetical protein
MQERRISLNITIQATDEQMADEAKVRELCIDKMGSLIAMGALHPDADFAFQENVTIEPFDD